MFSFFTPRTNSIFDAAIQNDVATVKKFLGDTFDLQDINEIDQYGWTALHYAAYHNHVEMVKFLLENGAKTSQHAHEISSGSFTDFFTNFRFNGGETPLMVTHSPVVAALLLDAGAKLDEKDLAGWTGLHWAMCRVNPDYISLSKKCSFALVATLMKNETSFALYHQLNNKGEKPITLCGAAESYLHPMITGMIQANAAVQELYLQPHSAQYSQDDASEECHIDIEMGMPRASIV